MKKLTLFLGTTILAIGIAGFIIFRPNYQNPAIQATNTSAPFLENGTIIPTESALKFNIKLEKLGNADGSSLVSLYTDTLNILELSAVTIKINLEDYSPTNILQKPFVLNHNLANQGITDQINKWSCDQEIKRCSIDLALLKFTPVGFTLDNDQLLGSIMLDIGENPNYVLSLDQEQSQALTKSGESVTINLSK